MMEVTCIVCLKPAPFLGVVALNLQADPNLLLVSPLPEGLLWQGERKWCFPT